MFEDRYPSKRPPCRAVGGICPVKGCDDDGVCYLAQCEQPLPAKTASDDDLLAHFAELVLTVSAAREVA